MIVEKTHLKGKPRDSSHKDKGALWYSRDTDLFSDDERAQPGSGLWLTPPFSVCFELGRRCNFRCQICISDSSPDHAGSDEWIPRALADIKKNLGSVRAVWSGGEPTIYRNIRSNIELSSSLDNANVLATNASKFLSGLAVDWIDISVYGDNAESFERYTRSSRFAVFQKNLCKYVIDYPRVSASFILGVHDLESQKNMVRLVVDSGIMRLKFHRLSLAGRNEIKNQLKSAQAEIREMQEFVSQWPVHASFTRTKTSDQKRQGYWVAKPPGVLTNSESSIPLDDVVELSKAISSFSSVNKSLVS